MEKIKVMNMEEKKKIEKIAMEDIVKVRGELSSQKYNKVQEIRKAFLSKPSQKAKDMLETYTKLQNTIKKLEKEIVKEGFYFSYIRNSGSEGKGEEFELGMNNYEKIPEEVKLEKEFEKKNKELSDMQREVVVGLYTTGTQAQEFLKNLADKLSKILG